LGLGVGESQKMFVQLSEFLRIEDYTTGTLKEERYRILFFNAFCADVVTLLIRVLEHMKFKYKFKGCAPPF
jgi:hypothetical protein